jgi:hypothetical protein
VVNYFARLEFQDGKRKRHVNPIAGVHAYHGRGTVHVHLLVWLSNVVAIDLPSVVYATVPIDNVELRSIVVGSQPSYSGSGWPVNEEPSSWDNEAELLSLLHTAGDHKQGLRAFMPDILGGLRCHMDVMSSDGRGMLLRYVAGYVPKFSDSFATEWLNDQASDYALAVRILADYHPLEPEMWLQLGAHLFPHSFAGGTMKPFIVPVPWKDDLPAVVQAYMACDWRRDDMPLLEYMRKANSAGAIVQYLRRNHKAANTEESLEEFANKYQTKGEIMIASTTNSRLSDKFYGQWLLLHVPFRTVADLWVDEASLVPEDYMNFALSLIHKPELWREESLACVRANLELYAYKDYYVESILSMVRAHRSLVDGYLSGQLDRASDPVPHRFAHVQQGPFELEADQQNIVSFALDRLRTSLSLAWPESEEARITAESADRSVISISGPAGSGKSYAIEALVHTAVAPPFNARALIVCPTGMLASTYREKFPGLDVDTVHGAFQLFKAEQMTLELMTLYDLILVEEYGQLSAWIFDRLLRLHDAAEWRPTLVFVGDFAQLRGVEPSRASDSWRWSELRPFKLHTMRRCKCDDLRWKLELLRSAKPSQAQLRDILKGHRAPSRWYREEAVATGAPTESDVGWIFHETPDTTFATISRAATARMNAHALKYFYGDEQPLAVVPGDPEANAENFYGSMQVYSWPAQVPIHIGMRVTLTRNINKDMDFVNGMSATVIAVHEHGIKVLTKTGKTPVIYPWTDEWHNTFLPLRLGYATTLHKIQGATLAHLTLYLDVPNIEAAAYVALSRVQYDVQWRFVGSMTRHHFTPASGI